MENLNIHFTKKAYKEYLKLPLNYKSLVDKTLSNLVKGNQIDIKMIKGEKDTFRIRIGVYRLLFIRIKPDIIIVSIKKREDAYK
jgi:mRNA-degrading endonuclease RelE of RelBE toxin-antitoxin system